MGASDVQVPAEWEGMQLRAEIGPMVAANYPDNVNILQARPIELSVLSGFALERFTEVAFRSIGVSLWEARAMARKFAAHPAWLLDIPADQVLNIQEVALREGTALLIEDFDENGAVERATVIRSTNERMYSLGFWARRDQVDVPVVSRRLTSGQREIPTHHGGFHPLFVRRQRANRSLDSSRDGYGR